MSLLSDISAIQRVNGFPTIPEHIRDGLNPKFDLRPYQVGAIQNYLTCFNNPVLLGKPAHVLFHMATGSGKTLIMVAAILDLYERGYRNFLFFVNSLNVLEKTKSNLLDASSSKFLFADPPRVRGKPVLVQRVDNFQITDPDAINICFTTIQGLHTNLNIPRENSLTEDDFSDDPVVLISDEAHHLNALTARNRTRAEDADLQSWESTVARIHRAHSDNVLLEFTATVDLEHSAIKEKYEDKILYSYPLEKFREEGYSKEIHLLRSDAEPIVRALRAVMLSQYRLKRFESVGLRVKPVILLKSRSIADNKAFFELFQRTLETLNGETIQQLIEGGQGPLEQAAKYFQSEGISWDALARELREDFQESRCKLLDSTNVTPSDQVDLNSLEDPDNPFRAIFVVNMLNEGWDVLNLFDIVRLHEDRDGRQGRPGKKTLQEAQLVGRGARYFPFTVDSTQRRFQRKYDSDLDNGLRICEELYFHSRDDHRYIQELKAALVMTGAMPDREHRVEYRLKESFKGSSQYAAGFVWLNRRNRATSEGQARLPQEIRAKTFRFRVRGLWASSTAAFDSGTEEGNGSPSYRATDYRLKDIPLPIVRKALARNPRYSFKQLKSTLPGLESTSDFLTSSDYLGDVLIKVETESGRPTRDALMRASEEALAQLLIEIETVNLAFEGTKEFYPVPLKEVITDRTCLVSNPSEDGEGVSQTKVGHDLYVDLPSKDWFAYEDNFGTKEEKRFVRYFDGIIDGLKEEFSEVCLIRNEGQAAIYSFEGGHPFYPDYILVLRQSDGECRYYQVFIEPKGNHLLAKDKWKEEFLVALEAEVEVEVLIDDCDFRVLGLPFYNEEASGQLSRFQAAFDRIRQMVLLPGRE